MMKTSIGNIVLFVISTWFAIFLFMFTVFFRLLITADIPIAYSEGEAKFYIVLLVLTTLMLLSMIVFSKNSIKPVTLTIGTIMLLFLVSVIRTYYTVDAEYIDVLIEWSFFVVFIVPTALGVVLMRRKRNLSTT
ncbi:hypothetical protein QT711_08225 [Sporosarcina saromensis]|uniref:Uncharacterized protein n=1 Tax=Sporosarcina saromensis TaxID=359365 RepID=A0ABU4G8C8_9BACL|nr:hypothetical protein [Sporosarcina saromensis]MDW0113171.1 hypothetical protein [Sporosarcina saromensis]